jgi:hypothetical protein
LPSSFLKEAWAASNMSWELPHCLTMARQVCDAYLIDVDGDGKAEVLLVGTEREVGAGILKEGSDGRWFLLARLPDMLPGCQQLRDGLRAGTYRTIPPRLQDLEIAGVRIPVQERNTAPTFDCGKLK